MYTSVVLAAQVFAFTSCLIERVSYRNIRVEHYVNGVFINVEAEPSSSGPPHFTILYFECLEEVFMRSHTDPFYGSALSAS